MHDNNLPTCRHTTERQLMARRLNKRLRGSSCGVLVMLAAMFVLYGCDGDGFDEFRARDATIADLENRSFTFSFVANGGPFDPALQGTPTTLTFGAFDAANTATFTLEASGAMASGSATFRPPILTMTFLQVVPALPFTANQELQLEVRADVDDGRVSVTNPVTGLETTSEPI